MRALKIAVVVMGILLVAGTVVLIRAIAVRISHRASVPTAAPAFTAQPIDLPPGARVQAITAGSDRLVIDLLLADGTRQFLILNLTTGQRIGVIPIRPAP